MDTGDSVPLREETAFVKAQKQQVAWCMYEEWKQV